MKPNKQRDIYYLNKAVQVKGAKGPTAPPVRYPSPTVALKGLPLMLCFTKLDWKAKDLYSMVGV